jgi:ubiquitin-protein ligase
MSLCTKRINRDILLCKKTYAEEFEKMKVYIHFDEDNIKYCYLMIYGPEQKYDCFAEKEMPTPYFGGYYLFKIKFSDNYPIDPPKIGFKSSFDTWRCHPNFYHKPIGDDDENLGAKVCLSLINTFGGDDWTPSRRLSEIIILLQERLGTTPIRFEPCYENVKNDDKRNTDFNTLIEYGNYNHAMLSLLQNPGEEFLPLLPIMKKLYIENFPKILDKMNMFKNKFEDKSISFSGVGAVPLMNYKVNMTSIIQRATELYEKIKIEDVY